MMTIMKCGVMFSVRFQADQYNRLKNDISKAVGEKKKVKFRLLLCIVYLTFLQQLI